MKVTLKFEDAGRPALSIKLTLPRKWEEGPCSKLLDSFIAQYALKHSGTPLARPLHLVAEDGRAIGEDEPVAKVLRDGEEIEVRSGAAPAAASAAAKSKPAAEEVEDVTTKEGLEKAKAKFGFDYSKWDRLDLSDDDKDDCHPNIELASWKRIKAQQRAERRAKEDAEIARLEGQLRAAETKLAGLQAQAATPEAEAQRTIDRTEAASQVDRARDRLEKYKATLKWVADDVGQVKEDRSLLLAKPAEPPKPTPAKPKAPPGKVGPTEPESDLVDYDTYIRRHEKVLREYAWIPNDRERSQQFMLDHPEILTPNGDGFLLLLVLDTVMRHRSVPLESKSEQVKKAEAKELRIVVIQHLWLNYVLELAKLSRLEDARSAVKPFFFKTQANNQEKTDEFQNEVKAFIARIEKRADEKLAAGQDSPLLRYTTNRDKAAEEEEEELVPAGLGPGGLDPNEVLQSLPKEMQDAFVKQDTEALKAILLALPAEEAKHHFKRCVDSGLWVPGGDDDQDDDQVFDDDDSEEEEEEGEAAPTPQAPVAAAAAASMQEDPGLKTYNEMD